jgi:hypothetical protein
LLLVAAAAAVAHAETVSFSAVYWDLGNQRWRDTATTPYEAGPIGSYDYASATLQFEYLESGPALTGVLTGSGLKPNFTYQVKLNGKPSYFWDAAGDDVANERLGFAGRWWLSRVERSTGSVVGGWNSDDAEYASWQSMGFTDGTYDYVFEGYLLFDYAVTDAAGDVSQTLTVDSSFHVLWKASQRPAGPNDSDPVAHVFVVDGASDWYASSQPDETRSLYAEWEPTRALPGELSLPVGSYAVRIFLTEESFHENAASPSSGRWATVMTHDDFRFAIHPPPACSDGLDNDGDDLIDFRAGLRGQRPRSAVRRPGVEGQGEDRLRPRLLRSGADPAGPDVAPSSAEAAALAASHQRGLDAPRSGGALSFFRQPLRKHAWVSSR